MAKPFLSIGIIFKNEIRCLERCLQSLGPLRRATSCELVMADTGSNDGSREVAEKYADILFDFPWIDDFAAARNAVMDRCSGKWYLSIDADEWLGGGAEEISGLAVSQQTKWDIASILVRNYQTPDLEQGGQYMDLPAFRMVRMSTGWRYNGRIHERWSMPPKGLQQVVVLKNSFFHHDGYVYTDSAKKEAKMQRNMQLLEQKLREYPQNLGIFNECIDSTRDTSPECPDYVRRAIAGVAEKWPGWKEFGPITYRNAAIVAYQRGLPEIEDWLREAEEQFPDSIFTRVDTFYVACCYWANRGNYDKAIHYGEQYRTALADYESKHYDSLESYRAVLNLTAPHWESQLLIFLSESYQANGQPEKCLDTLGDVAGDTLDRALAKRCEKLLWTIHAETDLDTAPMLLRFYEQIGRPGHGGADQVLQADFWLTATALFETNYLAEEKARGLQRHACTVFAPLAALQCSLGTAAAIMATDSAGAIDVLLAQVSSLGTLPVSVVRHALLCGAAFPLPNRPISFEEMDDFAKRLAEYEGPELLERAAERAEDGMQQAAWAGSLAAVVLSRREWTQDLALIRSFIRAERAFLPRFFAPELLTGENILILPSVHRFGLCCSEAVRALESGDAEGYVRLLRTGGELCPQLKKLVNFLTDRPQRSQTAPLPELMALAEKVRALLSAYAPDDPAVVMLKQSPAYQKVAHLIEGPSVGLAEQLKQ